MNNDLAALNEVRGMMMEIREAWRTVPTLMPAKAA